MKVLVGAFNQEKALVGAFSVIVNTGFGTDGALHSTTQVWEVKESLRKKQRRERNNDHSLGPPGRSRAGSRRASLRSPGGGGGNIAEVGLEILTHEYFRNKM